MEGVVASVMLRLPIFRHLFAWIGAHPAGHIILLSSFPMEVLL
jgi:hypothetical protein